MVRYWGGISGLAISLMLMAPVQAQDSLNNLAEELVRLRGDVETLNSELISLTDRHRAEMSSLAAQKGDLEATVRREDLRIRQLELDLEDNRDRADQAGLAGDALIPLARTILSDLEHSIQSGLPFKVSERMEALDAIRAQLEAGTQAPPRIINRLWSFYEDELRLTRENGLYSQVISLGADRVLADVAKLGSVAMYFQTRDGRMGHAVRQAEGWRFETLDMGAERNQIEQLFDSLKKQIRSGFFTLPSGTLLGEPAS